MKKEDEKVIKGFVKELIFLIRNDWMLFNLDYLTKQKEEDKYEIRVGKYTFIMSLKVTKGE